MSTAMVPAGGNALAVNYGFDVSSFPKPGTLELVQPINALDGKVAGQFFDKESNLPFESMQVVILKIGDGRTMFPPNSQSGDGSKPLCKSNDGKFPIFNDANLVPQADNCKSCPHSDWSRWQKNKTKDNIPPCSEQKVVLMLDRDSGLPYRYFAKKMALDPVRSLETTLYKLHLMSVGQNKRDPNKFPIIPIYGFTVTMSSERITKPGKVYYLPKFSAPKRIEDISEFGPIYEALVIRGQNATDEATTAVDAAVEPEYVEA